MPEHSPADRQILAILDKLQDALGGDFEKLETAEIKDIRAILDHKKTLIDLARYEDAKGLFWAHWRGLILGLSAILTALLLIWANVEKIAAKLAGVLF